MPTASTMLSRGKTGLCPFYTFNSSALIGRAVVFTGRCPANKNQGSSERKVLRAGRVGCAQGAEKKHYPPFAFGKKIVHLPKL